MPSSQQRVNIVKGSINVAKWQVPFGAICCYNYYQETVTGGRGTEEMRMRIRMHDTIKVSKFAFNNKGQLTHTNTHIYNNNLFSEDETRNCLANPLTNSLLCKWPKCLLSQTLLDLHSTHFECISKQDCKRVIRILPASEAASHHLNAIIVNSDIMQVS